MRKFFFFLGFTFYFLFSAVAQKINIDSLVAVVNGPKEDTGKVIAYRMLAGTLANTNPARAVEYARSGAALGKKIGFDKGIAGCYLNLAGSYHTAGKIDSALIYVDTAIIWSLKVGEPGRISMAYLNRGDYKRQLGDMKGNLIDCDTSLMYAEKANKDDARARVYHSIGNVYYAQDNYEQGEIYYTKAYGLYEKGNNKKMMGIIMNNLGNIYKHTKKYELAVTSFQNAIRFAAEANDKVSLPMYNYNMADAYADKGEMVQAEVTGQKALQYAREQGNQLEVAQAQLVLTDVFYKMGKFPAAIRAGQEAYQVFKQNEYVEESLTITDILSEIYGKMGNYKEAYTYAQMSRNLTDSVSRNKFNDQVATMQTKFKVDEKDKEIQLLAKDKELQQQKLKQQNAYIIAAVALALLAFIGIGLAINRYRLRQRMKELELRNQIAADLHDEVGSSLSSIHMLSQMATKNTNDAAHKDILARMNSNARETMDKMGDIVWMIKPGETEAGSLKQRMERFAYEICGSKNIELSMQLGELDKIKLTMDQRKNIYLVFKEALNNAVKYSGTEKIEVTVSLHSKELILQVKDFGKGFDSSMVKKGNGLDNMQYRANESGGKLRTETAINTGTTIQLVVPV